MWSSVLRSNSKLISHARSKDPEEKKRHARQCYGLRRGGSKSMSVEYVVLLVRDFRRGKIVDIGGGGAFPLSRERRGERSFGAIVTVSKPHAQQDLSRYYNW